MIQIKLKQPSFSDIEIPKHATPESAGVDIRANIKESLVIPKGGRELIPTGLFMEIPIGYYAQICSRSGLAAKNGVFVLNSPGTLDNDYRGEVKIILANSGDKDFIVNHGDRIAQFILRESIPFEFVVVSELNQTVRDSGGFGHSGVK